MRLIIQYNHALRGIKSRANAVDHLRFGLCEYFGMPPRRDGFGERWCVEKFTCLESVVVGNNNAGVLKILDLFRRNEIEHPIDVVR